VAVCVLELHLLTYPESSSESMAVRSLACINFAANILAVISTFIAAAATMAIE